MPPKSTTKHTPSKFTPLWIIAGFLSITEAALITGVIQTQGWIQGTLAIFFVLFTFAVAIAFFVLLWFKPIHFYAPSDYGNLDPQTFRDALRGVPSQAVEEIVLAAPPEDSAATQGPDPLFRLINNLLPDLAKQMLILMDERSVALPADSIPFRYRLGTHGSHEAQGTTTTGTIVQSLDGTEFIVRGGNSNTYLISSKGRRFVDWLRGEGLRRDYFESLFGDWGDPEEQTMRIRYPEANQPPP